MNPIRKAMASLPGHWMKGAISDGEGNFCGLGHVFEHGNFVESSKLADLMDKVAAEQYPERVTLEAKCEVIGDPGLGDFAAFNDHPDTTEAEVLAVMEKAAIQSEELHG